MAIGNEPIADRYGHTDRNVSVHIPQFRARKGRIDVKFHENPQSIGETRLDGGILPRKAYVSHPGTENRTWNETAPKGVKEKVNFYEQAFATMRRLGLGYNAQKEFFRRVVFNILCVNMDDHTKNISFLMDPEGRWSLSPAYDMGFCYNPSGQWANAHQMTIAGKRDGITRKDLLELAEKNDIRDAAGVIEQVDDAVSLFSTFAADARVPEDEVKFIMRFIDEKRKEMVGKAFAVE